MAGYICMSFEAFKALSDGQAHSPGLFGVRAIVTDFYQLIDPFNHCVDNCCKKKRLKNLGCNRPGCDGHAT